MTNAWPFFGRDDVLREIIEALESGSVVLHGPAGIGKTRLAAEVFDALRRRGVVVERIVGNPGVQAIAFQALRPLLGDAPIGDFVGPIHRALGLGATRPGPGDPVIVVDDAHLVDDATVGALVQVHAAGRVRLLLTTRTEQLSVGAVGPLLRSHGVSRISLSALDDASAAQLVGAVMGEPVDGRGLRRIVDAGRGNLLLLQEVVESAIRSGAARRRNGMWTVNDHLSATPILEDMVLERLSTRSKAEHDALELVVVGGALRLELLIAATSLGVVESLERSGLLVVTTPAARGEPPLGPDSMSPRPSQITRDGPIVDVVHPLYREVLVPRLGALARMRCHRQLAELAPTFNGDSADDRLQEVVWRLAGGLPIDPDVAFVSAQHALALNDVQMAGDLAIASFRASPSAQAATLACWCLSTNGRQPEAERLAVEAEATVTDDEGRAALALRRAEDLWWWAHRTDDALTALEDSAKRLGPGVWADLLHVQPSIFHALNGEARLAVASALPFENHPLIWVRRLASIGLGFGYALGDRGDEAIAASERAFNEALSDPHQRLSGDPAIHIVCRLFAGLYGPDSSATLQLAETVYGIAIGQPSKQSRAWAAMLLGMAHLASGHPRSAVQLSTEAELLWGDCQLPGLARWSASAIALAHLDLGDLDSAAQVTNRLRTYVQTGFAFNTMYEDRCSARLAFLVGDRRGARELLVSATRREAERGSMILVGDALHELVRLGEPDVAASLLELFPVEPVEPVELGALNSARRTLVLAASSSDAAGIEQVAAVFERMGRALLAAETFALASTSHRSAGRARESARCAELALAASRSCEGASVPLLAERAAHISLTPRELEIAAMASSGLANRVIAARLVLSERTIESHLYRVFAKLGVTTRDQLASQLPTVTYPK